MAGLFVYQLASSNPVCLHWPPPNRKVLAPRATLRSTLHGRFIDVFHGSAPPRGSPGRLRGSPRLAALHFCVSAGTVRRPVFGMRFVHAPPSCWQGRRTQSGCRRAIPGSVDNREWVHQAVWRLLGATARCLIRTASDTTRTGQADDAVALQYWTVSVGSSSSALIANIGGAVRVRIAIRG
jgi:hypothetical protein